MTAHPLPSGPASRTPGGPRRVRRVRARRVLCRVLWRVLAVLLLLGGAGVLFLLRDPTPHFLARRSHLVAASASPPERVDGHLVQVVRLTAASGLEVELAVKRPAPGDALAGRAARPQPLVVLLGGHRTGRDAVRLIPETRGTIVAALAYPYRGDPREKGPKVLLRAPAIRAAVLDTPPAVMLALDYLLDQPGVDPGRVELAGVSFGAPFACIAAALDPRVTRVWSIHGAGAPYLLLEHNLRRYVPFPPLRAVAAGVLDVLLAGPRLAPERWVGRIAPRPFVMVNARGDERIPRAAVERLYAAAGEPKDLTWMPGGHVGSRRTDVVLALVRTVLDRIHADADVGAAGGERRGRARDGT